MFTGEYHLNLDTKGRMMIPAKFREDGYSEKARKLKRYILGSAVSVECDKQGRILIPQVLRDKAELEKDVMLLGVGDYAEIWSAESYEEKNDFSDTEELAKDMEGMGI